MKIKTKNLFLFLSKFQLRKIKRGKTTTDKDSGSNKLDSCSSFTKNSSGIDDLRVDTNETSSSLNSIGFDAASPPGKKSTEDPTGLTTPHDRITSNNPDRISPTSLLDSKQVGKKMKKDGIFKQLFYKQGNDDVKDAVRFLYGIDYGSGKSKNDRIEMIKQMVDESGGNLGRLCANAFQTSNNQNCFSDDKRESFLNMAVSSKIFFDSKAFGGFTGEPFMRYQRGDNQTCWMVAVCVWITLLIRKQIEGTPEDYVVDIPQRVRRYFLDNPEKRDTKIENRVIHNTGDYTSQFAGTCYFINYVTFEPFLLSSEPLKNCINKYGPGLVTQFRMTTEFIRAARSATASERNTYGYWKFVGNSKDDEGEFVTLTATAELEKFRRELDEKVRMEMGTSPAVENGAQQEAGTSSNGGTRRRHEIVPMHAMVLFGGKKFKVFDSISYKEENKDFFLCLNSWPTMPLVLFSIEYLQACEAQVVFRKKPVTEPDTSNFKSNTNSCGFDMVSPHTILEDESDVFHTLPIFFDDDDEEEQPFDLAAPPYLDDGDY